MGIKVKSRVNISSLIIVAWVFSLVLFGMASFAQAAITHVKTVGTVNAKGAASTTTTFTVGASGASAGNNIIIAIVTTFTNGDEATAVTCTDTRGNTYTTDFDVYTTIAARSTICSSRLTTSLTTGDVITVTHASTAARAFSVDEFSGLAAANPLDKTASAFGTSLNALSASTATTTQADELIFGAVGVKGPVTETYTQGASYTALTRDGTTGASAASNRTINPEYKIVSSTGTYAADGTLGTSTGWVALVATYKAATGPTTTLATGTDPGNTSIAPGGAATNAGAFSFQTSSGTDVITAATVTLAAGTSGGLSLVEITSADGATVYGSVTNPASDTPAITLSTNTLTATTTLTEYRIRVTPKSHANMPAPVGSSYAVTARISAWTGTNNHAGSDTAGTTVTIDNLSTANVTASTATAGDAQVALAWTNPADADKHSIIVLRRAYSAVADTPVEGTTYSVGDTIGSSTVACVTASPGTSCTDTVLANYTFYNYKIFVKDTNGNYSATGVVPTGSPAKPEAPCTVFETAVYKTCFAQGHLKNLFFKLSSSPTTDVINTGEIAFGYGFGATTDLVWLNYDPSATFTVVQNNSAVYQIRYSGALKAASGTSYGSSTVNLTFYRDRFVMDTSSSLSSSVGASPMLYSVMSWWNEPNAGTTYRYCNGTPCGAVTIQTPAASWGFYNKTSPFTFQEFNELGATDGLATVVTRDLSTTFPTAYMDDKYAAGVAMAIAVKQDAPVIGTTYRMGSLFNFDTGTGFNDTLTQQHNNDYITPATLNFTGGDGSVVGTGFDATRDIYTLDDNSANDHVKFTFTVGTVTPRITPVFEITNWNTSAPSIIGVGGVVKYINTDYIAAVSGTTLTLQYLSNLSADTIIEISPTVTIVGDGTTPASRNVGRSTTNRAVDAFTLSTSSGTDTLTGLTVTLSGTGVAADIAASGVKIWKDNGTVPNEWDAGDTQIGSGVSMSGTTAVFSGLTESITTTSTQYLITYDISAAATPGNTLLGRVSAATTTNALTNNDTTDNTLTVATTAVSGTVYTDEGTTNIGLGKIVHLVKNGVTVDTVTTNADGTYAIPATLVAGDAILVYINNDATYKANTVTKVGGTSISGLNLYAGRVITRCDNACSLTNANMSTALGAYTDAGDILYSVSGGNLTVSGTATTLFMPTGHTFLPGGNVTTTHVKIYGTWTATGTETYNVNGDYVLPVSGTFTQASSTINLTGTGIFEVDDPSWWTHQFFNVNAAAAGKTTTIYASSGINVKNVLTLGTGTLTGGSVILSNSGGTQPSLVTAGATLSNNTFKYSGVAGPVTVPSAAFPVLQFAPDGNVTYNLAGDISCTSLSIYGNSATFTATLDTTVSNYAITCNSLQIGSVATNVYGNLKLNNSVVTINGNVTIKPSGAGGANSIVANTATLNVAGNWSNSDTFTAGTSSVILNGAALQNVTACSACVNGNFNNLTITNASAAGVSFLDAFNTANITDTTAGSKLTFKAGATYGITSTLTLTGTSGNEVTLLSDSAGTRFTLNPTGAAQAVTYVDVKDSQASTNNITASGATNSGGNDDAEAVPHWIFDSCPTVTSTADSGAGTLRSCIAFANSNPGTTISFNIPGPGNQSSGGDSWWRISPASALSTITAAGTIIDATTQTTNQGNTNTLGPEIELYGGGGAFNGFNIQSANNTIRGMILTGFGTAGDTVTGAVLIDGAGATGNTVAGNYIGTNYAGTAAPDDATYKKNERGIYILNGAASNTIGGTAAADRNVIAGNRSHGIWLRYASTNNNVIIGNYIGINAVGTAAIANSYGIYISTGGPQSNRIGGTTAGERNIISGNTNHGIWIRYAGTTNNQVIGNYIGTDVNGTAAVPNGNAGLYISTGTTSNTIGGATAAERNIISGNTNYGVWFNGTGTNSNNLYGNYIGLDKNGTTALPNGSGVLVDVDAQSNAIGGSVAGQGNIISGNTNNGAVIGNGNAISNINVYGNKIGTGPAGTETTLGNGASGVVINSTTTPSNITIGGTNSGEANLIAYQGGDGIYLSGATSDKVIISGNSIHSNTGLGIDLDPDGVGASGGANNDKARPTITSITPSGANFTIVATVTASDTIEFFRVNNATAPVVTADGTGSGEGYLFLGSCVDNGACSGPHISAVADANAAAGTVQATLLSSGLTAGDYVTATATDAVNGTSEFAANMATSLCPGNVVTTTADTGAGSLRECINKANTNAGADTITFNIAGCPGGLCTITPATVLPSLSDATGGTTINGYTQTGAAVNTDANATNASLKIEINGGGATFNGINITSANNTIKGLIIRNFAGGIGHAIDISGGTSTGNNISGNFIGTDSTGTAAGPGNWSGVYVASPSTIIGMDGTNNIADRNLISANNNGIYLLNTSSSNTIKGNLIGTDKNGTAALGNTAVGMYVVLSGSNTIGGTTTAERNVFSGNTNAGIDMMGGAGNTILGNYIGVDINGASLPNGTGAANQYGIRVCCGATSTTIGGTASGAGNLIGYNASPGILVAVAGTSIIGNTILNNTQEGILSSADGITMTKNLISNNGTGGTKYDGILLSAAAATGQKIYQNTIYANGKAGIALVASSSATIKNNLITNNGAWGINNAGTITLNNNGYFGNTSGTCTGTGCPGTSNITTDPLYVNAAGGNFSLTECTSPAINMGIDLGADQPDMNGASAGNYNNNAPDMGAFETSTACVPSLSIVKQVWEENGTAPLTSPVTAPTGSMLVFLIYVKNTTAGLVSDVRINDGLAEAGFEYIAGSLRRTSDSTPPSDTATDLAIFTATGDGSSIAETDAVNTVPGADTAMASAQDTGGLPDVDRITIGAVAGQANAALGISGHTTFAVRFKARVK